ncbi:MAG: prolyl oligopeptidase family serine peptidase [Phycisphaerae bacterium]|nr:prolyl oligopeptidase family serine peptidase [Phycisphaerae bacterium]
MARPHNPASTTTGAPATTRREFAAALGWTALTGVWGSQAAGTANSAALSADTPRELRSTGADLGSLLAEVERIAGRNRPVDSFLGGTYRSFDEFQERARQRIFDLILYQPQPVEPRPEVLERRDCGDHVREKIVFSTAPGVRVPAFVLIPKDLKQPGPAMVDLHSHGGMFMFGKEKVVDLGANHPAMTEYHRENYDGRPTATALVRRGYVVITIDALMFGERRVVLDADLASGWDRAKLSLAEIPRLNAQCRAKEATLVKALTFAGATWPGLVFWDDIRTVDYLVTRPEVDPSRLGCQGISMGGYRAMFLAALDPRIKAGCIVGFMSTVRPMIHHHVDTHSWVHFLPALHRYLDWPDVASLAAPRSLLVLQCERDGLFPPAGMKESVEKIATVFERAGAQEKFTGRFYDEPHHYTRRMQDDAFAWFDRQLGVKS